MMDFFDSEEAFNRMTIAYESGALFERRCPVCSKMVKADNEVMENEITGPSKGPNATCKVHGRIAMRFLGYF